MNVLTPLADRPDPVTLARLLRRNVLLMCAGRGQGYAGQGLALADLLGHLYGRAIRDDSADHRDRFVLSTGHSAVGLFAVLGALGLYDLPELQTYGQDGSRIEESPLEGLPGFEITGGALGHGLSQAVGLALGERTRGGDGTVYCLVSDGELQEGQVWEAAMSAGHHRLGNLVLLVDNNGMQADGATAEVMNIEPVDAKLAAFGFEAHRIDPHDHGVLARLLPVGGDSQPPRCAARARLPDRAGPRLGDGRGPRQGPLRPSPSRLLAACARRSRRARRNGRLMYTALLTDADRFPFSGEEIERLAEGGIEVRELAGHDGSELRRDGGDVDAVFVYSATLDAAVLDSFLRCRIVMRCGSGYERIDVDAARRRDIAVSYVPAYGSVDVAEHALMLMLACARRVVDAATAVRTGGWPPYQEIGPMHRLRGRTLGLIGYGRIARELAAMARGLGMVVVAHDPFVAVTAFDDDGVRRDDLAGVIAAADVISVHVPLTEQTEGLIDASLLRQVKPGAIFVNASRGELVDEPALVEAIADGRIAGAGLDVLAGEPPDPDSPLLSLPNVIVTPHSAAFTDEALAAVRGQAIDEVLRVLGGERPHHPVPDEREAAGR